MLSVVKKGEFRIAVRIDKEWPEKREVNTQNPFHKRAKTDYDYGGKKAILSWVLQRPAFGERIHAN